MNQKCAFLFPGQGSQYIGMGQDIAREFPVAKDVFDAVDEALNQKLSSLMFAGDMDTLIQTQNAQPAIMAVSMAVWRVLETETDIAQHVDCMAGHSLGEYSALCAAGVLSLSECAHLLQVRGRAMSRAAEQTSGGMVALLGASIEQAREIATQSGCYVANDNCPGQVVISGSLINLTGAKMLAEQMGIKRAVMLKVAGAFHSPLMQSAADELGKALQSVHFQTPKYPVYSNVTAKAESEHFDQLLLKQLISPVRWTEIIQSMNTDTYIECGPKNVLSGLVGRIKPSATTLNTTDVEQLKNVIQTLSAK